MLSTASRQVLERKALVCANVRGQAQHSLGNDVLQDFIGPARDAQAGCIQVVAVHAPLQRSERGITDQSELLLTVDQFAGEFLQPLGGDELPDRSLRSGCL